MLPATMGANRPKKLAKQLVNDIKIPAKRGVRSRWFILKPDWMAKGKWKETFQHPQAEKSLIPCLPTWVDATVESKANRQDCDRQITITARVRRNNKADGGAVLADCVNDLPRHRMRKSSRLQHPVGPKRNNVRANPHRQIRQGWQETVLGWTRGEGNKQTLHAFIRFISSKKIRLKAVDLSHKVGSYGEA